MAKSIEEKIASTMKRVREGDPTFWRHPLANATVALLERGVPVTINTLIEQLQVTGEGAEVVLRQEVSEAAIERLRQIVVKKD